jgi:formate hydrogenlyase subunit 3/multisubunit Na+/H+ antiporter MnhD subunit
MTPTHAYLFFRYARWLLWLAALGYSADYLIHPSSHTDSFNHLLRTTAFWMFTLPNAALFAGFLELMMRDKAGLARPKWGQFGLPR